MAVTIRADRHEPLRTAPELAEIQTVVFDQLKPMPPGGYAEVIIGPARRATAAGRRLSIESALVERLAETANGADALPLLALTLERLYRDFGADGDLTVADYESMGGMARVVQTEVDKILAADPDQRQTEADTLHHAFIPWLATINPDNDQPMRRLARWDDLPTASHPLIQAMVDKRLLVKDTRNGQTLVEVALESLLRQWRELAAWLRDESKTSGDADGLERAAATGRPATATNPGCWEASAWPQPKPSPPNPASVTALTPPATTCWHRGNARTPGPSLLRGAQEREQPVQASGAGQQVAKREEQQGQGVFLCYRREESRWQAGRLADALVDRFGDRAVFIDVDRVRIGNWRKQIDQSLADCAAVIVVIGPQWLAEFEQRSASDDPVRYEIAQALLLDKIIIPVTVDRAPLPHSGDLPDDIAALNDAQGYELGVDVMWRPTLGKLLDDLSDLLRDRSTT